MKCFEATVTPVTIHLDLHLRPFALETQYTGCDMKRLFNQLVEQQLHWMRLELTIWPLTCNSVRIASHRTSSSLLECVISETAAWDFLNAFFNSLCFLRSCFNFVLSGIEGSPSSTSISSDIAFSALANLSIASLSSFIPLQSVVNLVIWHSLSSITSFSSLASFETQNEDKLVTGK